MKTLGEKLKAARMEQKMSQNEVAEKLLVSRQSISKWENVFAYRIWKIFRRFVSCIKSVLMKY